MTKKNGIAYGYGGKPHAVTSAGFTYIYDANGNMTTRGSASLTWDAENRLTGVTGSATYIYDGDGFRVKKIEGGATIAYINQYYEKNITTATVTLYYYLSEKMMAYKEGTSLRYIHQEHLSGTSVVSDSSGAVVGRITYKPFGETRTISAPWLSAQKFTGQRLDDMGLYYYGARYYDPALARFISADTIVPNFENPQIFNRYSYVQNNPLKYSDPTGNEAEGGNNSGNTGTGLGEGSGFWIGTTFYWFGKGNSSGSSGSSNSNGSSNNYSYNIVYDTANDSVTFYYSGPFSVHIPGIFDNPGLKLGSGQMTIYGNATYKDGQLNTYVSILTGHVDMPPGIEVTYNVNIILGSTEYPVYLVSPKGPFLVPDYPGGYTIYEGKERIGNVPAQYQATLSIYPAASDRYAPSDELRVKVVMPWQLKVDLRTGTVSRRDFWWSD